MQRRVGDLVGEDIRARLGGSGLGVRVGPFDLLLRVDVDSVAPPLLQLYRDHLLLEGEHVYNCHAELREVWHFARAPRRRIRFQVDGIAPHEDMPAGQALAVLEWGLNLAIAMRFHGFLMLHSGVMERGGRAVLFPAWPGFGKTTLCAALAHRGWRLFSDEFGLVRPGGTVVTPIPRPMPLKNQSIQVIRDFAPGAEFGPVIPNTRKGTIAHMKPPTESVRRAHETAPVAWIVFPRWIAGAPLSLEEVSRTEGFMQLATNAFNYELLGEAGFETVRGLVDSARCLQLVYSNLDEAVAALSDIADGNA
jgi:HprK-related kinase A